MQFMLLSFAVSKIQQKMSLLCGNGQAVNGEGESLQKDAFVWGGKDVFVWGGKDVFVWGGKGCVCMGGGGGGKDEFVWGQALTAVT